MYCFSMVQKINCKRFAQPAEARPETGDLRLAKQRSTIYKQLVSNQWLGAADRSGERAGSPKKTVLLGNHRHNRIANVVFRKIHMVFMYFPACDALISPDAARTAPMRLNKNT